MPITIQRSRARAPQVRHPRARLRPRPMPDVSLRDRRRVSCKSRGICPSCTTQRMAERIPIRCARPARRARPAEQAGGVRASTRPAPKPSWRGTTLRSSRTELGPREAPVCPWTEQLSTTLHLATALARDYATQAGRSVRPAPRTALVYPGRSLWTVARNVNIRGRKLVGVHGESPRDEHTSIGLHHQRSPGVQ
jgi:hypothetical protein